MRSLTVLGWGVNSVKPNRPMTRPISAKTAEHYTWGGPQGTDCDGWHLLKTPDLSIIEERLPPGTREQRHLHRHARQFFLLLEGELVLEIEREEFVLGAGEGLEIAPEQAHQAINRSSSAVRFLVTSQPPSHGDRIVSSP
jgi:mannose-6-phosphate isomerase-like protein (cupin superfamily)